MVTIESDGNVQSAGNAANPPSEMSRPADTFEPVRGGIAQPRPEPTRGFSVQTADETPKKFSGNDIIAMLRKRRMEQQQCGPSIPQTSTNGTRLLGKTGVVGGASGLTPPSRAPILKRSPPSPLLFKRPKPNDDYGSDGEGDTAERERKAMRPSTFGARNTVVTGNGDGSEPRPFAQRKFGAFKPPTQTNLQNFSRLLAGNKDATSSQKLLRQRSPLFSQRSQQPSSFSSSPSPSPSSPSPLRPSSSSSPSSSSPSRRPLQPHPGQGGVSFPASLGELRFPTLDECAAYSSIPVEDLGDSFSTLSEYKKAFSAALCREIQVTINESVTRICGLISSRPSSSASSSSSRSPNASALIARKCGHKGMIVRTAKKAGPNQGRQFVKCDLGCFFWVDELSSGPGAPGASSSSTSSSPARHRSVFDGVGKDDEVYLRGQGVGLYLSCELSQRRTAQGRWRGPQSGSGSFVLGLPWKERASAYAKDDLWAVRVSGETLVFRSSFHGPTKSGEVELTPLSRRCFSVCGGGEYLPCQALHGPNLSTELAMLDNLLAAAPTTAPIVPFLVSPRGATAATTCGNPCESAADAETVAELVDGVVAERGLNADQERVVRECVRVALGVDPVPPVVLVHGVFGSGKSSVVAAVLTLIDALAARLDESDAAVETRVLFAAATNAAVDRVLLQLLREGFTSFLRVGSRRKIARELLPYSLHGMGSDDDDVGELREMLREAKSPEDRASIAAEIKEVAAGGMAHRRELLETVRVVGATSAACSFPVMDACHFRVVFLDECCQMVEPLSLLSLGNFGCERAILVGDPQQLRPVLASSLGLDSADAGTGTGTAPSEGLSRTLFARLVRCGVEPIMLRTQYRCHPAISAIASKLFYGGRLLDGVSREDRAPLVPGLPPVVLCHAERGKEEADGWGSFFNTQEALAVAALVKILCESYAILPEQVGVIALCKYVLLSFLSFYLFFSFLFFSRVTLFLFTQTRHKSQK